MLMVGLLLCAAVTQAELLSNNSFEDDTAAPIGAPDNWGAGATSTTWGPYYGNGSYAYVEDDAAGAYDGTDYIVLDGTGGGWWNFTYAWYTQDFPNVVEGAEYFLSAYVRIDTSPSVVPVLKIEWYAGPGAGQGRIVPDAVATFPEAVADGQYHLIRVNGTAPADATWGRATLMINESTGVDVAAAYFDLAKFEIRAATNPDPADDSVIDYTTQTTLSWINPEPKVGGDTLTSDVYLLESATSLGDPNFTWIKDAGASLLADDTTAESVAISPALANNMFYYWAVEVTDPNGADPSYQLPVQVWSFATGDAPVDPNAGPDQYDWLDPTSATVALNGLIDDDGASPVTTLWEVDPADAAVVSIASPTSLNTTATVTATGAYTITLTATDGTGSLSDTMVANVYDDACAAAIADPADAMLTGDISGPSGTSDCVVNMYDFAAMAANWVECASAKLGCTP
jgi:hypothetical protein